MPDNETGRMELPPDPTAARQARTWLKALLDGWTADGMETVQLLVSELVTNAVLHTGDRIEVVCHRTGPAIKLDVIDYSPAKPVIKDYAADAATGRGLHLVQTLADAWGVQDGEDHKAVWFSFVDDRANRAVTPDLGDTGDWSDLESWPDLEDTGVGVEGTPIEPPEDGDREVCLLGVPLAVYLATEEHHDALARELTLLSRESPSTVVPPRLQELAGEVAGLFGSRTDQLRDQAEAARHRGEPAVDIIMFVPQVGWEAFLVVCDQLDEADVFCEQADLLTLASPPQVRRFRRWVTGEIANQMQGLPPTRWPGTSSEEGRGNRGPRGRPR